MDLADHIRVIASNWWRILLVAVVVAVGVFTWSRTQPELYEAGTLLSVTSVDIASSGFVTEEQLAFRANFYAAIAETLPIARSAVELGKLEMGGEEALGRYVAFASDTAGFVYISAGGATPEEARAVADGVAKGLAEYVREEQERVQNEQVLVTLQKIDALEDELRSIENEDSSEYRVLDNTLAGLRGSLIEIQNRSFFQIRTVAPAFAKRTPVSPTPGRDATLAFLVAFVVTAEGLVVARAFSDRFARTNDAGAITELTGLPVLAMIPRGRGPEVVESFRTLRTNLMFLEGAGRPRTIAVVSPNPGSGKSFVAIHLAESAVAVDASVVLIDADLRRPVIHSRVRVPREPGLSNALRGGDMHEALHKVPNMPSLRVMPSGSPVSDTVGVLGGRAFRQILDSLDTAELVVVDTPPGAVYADALAVSAQCDAALLVLDAKSTRRRAARHMIDSLERTGATLIGVVVNGAQFSRRDAYERS